MHDYNLKESYNKSHEKVEAGLNLFQGMLCQAKKNGLADSLPEKGKTLDLASTFDDFAAAEPDIQSVSKGSIKRLEDQDGKATYRSDVKFNATEGRVFEIGLIHSPEDEII